MNKRFMKIASLVFNIAFFAFIFQACVTQRCFADVKPLQLSDISVKGPWVDVRAYSGGLAEACADSYTEGKEIRVPNSQTLTADLTPTRDIRIIKGGKIDGPFVLNMSNANFFGADECFGSSIAVQGLQESYPDYWQIDGISDEVQIQKADSASDTVLFKAKTYYLSSVITATTNWSGAGRGKTIFKIP